MRLAVDFFGCGPNCDWYLEIYDTERGFQEFFRAPGVGLAKVAIPEVFSKYHRLPRYHPLTMSVKLSRLDPEFRVCGIQLGDPETPSSERRSSPESRKVFCFLERYEFTDDEPTYFIASGVFSTGADPKLTISDEPISPIPGNVQMELVKRSPFCPENGYDSNIRDVLFGREVVIINLDCYAKTTSASSGAAPLSLWKENGWTYVLVQGRSISGQDLDYKVVQDTSTSGQVFYLVMWNRNEVPVSAKVPLSCGEKETLASADADALSKNLVNGQVQCEGSGGPVAFIPWTSVLPMWPCPRECEWYQTSPPTHIGSCGAEYDPTAGYSEPPYGSY